MSRPNARSIGSMLEKLKEEAKKGDNIATKPLPEHDNAKKSSTSDIKPTCSAEANSLAERDSDSTQHPKAVGSLLKMMQTEKGRFYEKPPEQTSKVKIFMPLYQNRFAKTKKTEKKEDCFCSLCKVSCTSQIVLDAHLAGKKHKKNVEKLKGVTNTFSPTETVMTDQTHGQQGTVADIQEGFDVLAFSEPLVGLEYITEYQKPDSKHRYFCEMCELKSNYDGMLGHVVSRQHRLRFMRIHCLDIYSRVTGYPSFKNILLLSDADKLLKQHSGFVIRRLLKGKIRLCKVKRYNGEKGMTADLKNYQGSGKVHPSWYKDLPKAEKLFEEEEAREKEEIRQQELMEKRKINQDRLKSQTELKFNRASDLLEVRQLEDEVLRSRLREERLEELDEQERRIVIALRKLREGSVGGEMTREEAIAGKKLALLLKTIRGEKNRYGLMQKRRGLDMETRELSTEEPPLHQGASVIKPLPASSVCADTVDLFSRKNLATEQNDVCLAREITRGQNDEALSEFRKVVAPIIEKTRLQVEEKIFQALSGGTLSSLIDTLKNNPKLQASLKQWELQQSAKVEDSLTKQVPAIDLKNNTHTNTLLVHFESTSSEVARVYGSEFQNDLHPSTHGRHSESFDSNLHGSDFQNDSRPSTSSDHFESINSKPTKAYRSDYQNDSVPSTRARHFESFDSDQALVHESDFQNDSRPSTSGDHFESINSKPTKAYRSDYQNDSVPRTRARHFESFDSDLALVHESEFQNDSRTSTSRDHFESVKSMPAKECRRDYQNDSDLSTRARHFESFDSDQALIHESDFQNDSRPSTSRDHFESVKSKPAKACRSDYQNNLRPSTRGEKSGSLSSRLQMLAGGNLLTVDSDKTELKKRPNLKHLMPRRRPRPMSPEQPPIPKRPKQTVPDRGDLKGNREWNEMRAFQYRDYDDQTAFRDSRDDFDGADFCSDTTSRLSMKDEHSVCNRQTGLLGTNSTLEMPVSKSLSGLETKNLSSGLLGSRPQFSGSSSKFHSGF